MCLCDCGSQCVCVTAGVSASVLLRESVCLCDCVGLRDCVCLCECVSQWVYERLHNCLLLTLVLLHRTGGR